MVSWYATSIFCSLTMITLIHGDDTAVSRNYFFELKSKTKDSFSLDGSKITITDLTQALEGQDLFGDSKDIFIEELLSKRKASKELDSLIEVVLNAPANIFLWESKELTPKQAASFKKATVKVFKIPATIFALLDGLRPKNGKQLVELFHKTLEDKDAEFVFFMLQRQVRILLALSSKNPEKQISEVVRIAPWQKGKSEKQATLFTTDALLYLHGKLFDIEYGLKTGNLSLPLIPTIDMLLLSL